MEIKRSTTAHLNVWNDDARPVRRKKGAFRLPADRPHQQNHRRKRLSTVNHPLTGIALGS